MHIPSPSFQTTIFILCLMPLLALPVIFLQNGLGANPIEYVIRYLGDWALRFLLIALAVTPVRRFTGWTRLATVRRMIGLYAFFYVILHLFSYVGLDLFFDLQALFQDILKRKFITIGMLAFILLIPLAMTSTNKMIKRVGAKRWQKLHKLVYVISPLAVLHYFWMVKADISQPLIYGSVIMILLALRLPKFRDIRIF